MNDAYRNQIALIHEGQILTAAGQTNEAQGATLARAVIDGALNALIRLEGSEEASKYAFALADRIVGRVKGVTAWPVPIAAPAVVVPPPAQVVPAKPASKRMGFWTIFAVGWVCGFAIALAVTGGLR